MAARASSSLNWESAVSSSEAGSNASDSSAERFFCRPFYLCDAVANRVLNRPALRVFILCKFGIHPAGESKILRFLGLMRDSNHSFDRIAIEGAEFFRYGTGKR